MWPTLPGVGEQKERMLRGELYRYDDPDLRADHVRAQLLLERFNATSVVDTGERRAILEELLGEIGADVEIKPPFLCDYGYQTTVARAPSSTTERSSSIAPRSPVGRHCQVATNVQLLTATHPLEPGPRRDGWESAHPIVIEDGVWLGGGVIVCPGVTIGEDTVVGAGSVVVTDLPSGVLAVGSPCRRSASWARSGRPARSLARARGASLHHGADHGASCAARAVRPPTSPPPHPARERALGQPRAAPSRSARHLQRRMHSDRVLIVLVTGVAAQRERQSPVPMSWPATASAWCCPAPAAPGHPAQAARG